MGKYLCQEFAELFNFARAIVAHGDSLHVQRLNDHGRSTGFTDDVKIGYIKFDNGSRIIAFSAHPQAMAVHGGDVGLDEFAKHPNAQLLWETAQGRVTWGGDLAVWSSHDGLDTLFNNFIVQARSGGPPWNLYYRVTLPDAIDCGLLDTINRVQDTQLSRDQFLADCRARAGSEEIFQQAYMCNPMGAAASHIVEYSAKTFPGRFTPVNFSSKKHDLGFALMNQLATAKKRFPRGEQDIAADYFALRKTYEGARWVFSESPNSLNPASHCDIAWPGGLATEAHTANKGTVDCRLG